MSRNAARLLIVLTLLTAATGARAQRSGDRRRDAAPAPPPAAVPAAAPAPGVEPYRIGPEDLLDISVWNNDAVSRVVPVRPDGRISLPLVPDMQAAGLTPVELRDALRRSLTAYITSPEVSVVVKEVHSFKVSVLGEVKLPGRYELKSRATILDAIAMAGGFNEFAARARIVVLRQSGAGVQRLPFNYSDFVTRNQAQEGTLLRPNDIVIVP
ncbi:MAG: polysaccharide export protein [Acidobacteriia bacterium]|nr:polysaccharide export protein [Terriglobia bacterium]